MRINSLCCLCAGVFFLAGCSSTTNLSAAGQAVKFTDTQPGSECRMLGTLTGVQGNWLSGNGGEDSSMRGAANDLRNKAAAMGGNTIYGAVSPTSTRDTYLSSFVPLDSKIQGQVYQCQ
ncbi:DUF4156 domain-containing protein [Biostraticola tofi]|uniref:Uncharacterized protein DUF4156 n=1 Tax=Biostraticola tofi TaxID=466109 RepID=A0A4R3Z3U9_9GAMM|nr:DUF4156 domain-containing protein [Biostraticola tofi]TCV98983.1 uncharacterized protein DUF4156 [Biostraticola tofi]